MSNRINYFLHRFQIVFISFASRLRLQVRHRSSVREFDSCKSSVNTRKYQNKLLFYIFIQISYFHFNFNFEWQHLLKHFQYWAVLFHSTSQKKKNWATNSNIFNRFFNQFAVLLNLMTITKIIVRIYGHLWTESVQLCSNFSIDWQPHNWSQHKRLIARSIFPTLTHANICVSNNSEFEWVVKWWKKTHLDDTSLVCLQRAMF